MAYTALAYSYWASFHDAYICLHHAHYQYRLQLPYKSHRTYLTNLMGLSISHHITPIVINSLGGGHTNTHTHTHTHTHTKKHAYRHSRTDTIQRNQERASHRLACARFKYLGFYTIFMFCKLYAW